MSSKPDFAAVLSRVGETLRQRTGSSGPMGSFSASVAIGELAQFSPEDAPQGLANLDRPADATWPRNPDPLAEARPAVKRRLVQVFDWGTAEKHTIKPVVELCLGLLFETYCVAVEAISFVATASRLLSPAQIVDLLEAIRDTANAYAPIRFPARVASKLEKLLSHYPPARRLQLLISLWKLAHDGRWWDHTTGAPRRYRRNDEVALGRPFDPHDGLVDELCAGSVSWHPRMVEWLPGLSLSDRQVAALVRTLSRPGHDPDVDVAASYIRQLRPTQRPDSPIIEMVEILASQYLVEDADPAELLPARPEEWSELYSAASNVRFPFPREFMELHGRPMPGLSEAEVAVCRSAAELTANAEFMGNCTAWPQRIRDCEKGVQAIIRVAYRGETYNASIFFADGRVGEVNSRFNQGNVPPEVRTACERLARWAATLRG